MLRVVFADVLDTKVVDDEGEGDGACSVMKESWRVWRGAVAMAEEVGDETLAIRN
jgi:hypothetical protein